MLKYINKRRFSKEIYMDRDLYYRINNNDDRLYSLSLIAYLFDHEYDKMKYAFLNYESFSILLLEKKNDNNPFSRKVVDYEILIDKKEFLNQVLEHKKYSQLTIKEEEEYEFLKKCMSQKLFESKTGNIKYYYNKEYKEYSFKEVFNKLKMNKDEFIKSYNNNRLGINLDEKEKDYMLNSFINMFPFQDVEFDPTVIANYKYLKKNIRRANFQKILINNSNNPSYLKKVKVNEEFKKIILKDIPKEFNDIEKSFLIYIKMCSILDYDERYATIMQNDDYIKELKESIHNKVSNLKNITVNNNTIVCQEFVALYTKLLDEIGIKYVVKGNEKYELGHPIVQILYNNFITQVDPTMSVIDSDICFIKNGLKSKKFDIVTKDDYSKDEFEGYINNVYDYIKKRYNIEYKSVNERFYNNQDMIQGLSFNEKIMYLNKAIEKVKNTNIPKCFFVKYVARSLFLEDVSIEYIIEKQVQNIKNMNLGIVLSIKDEDGYKFYKYSNDKLEEYSKNKLKNKFLFKYFETLHLNHEIKGLDNIENFNTNVNDVLLKRFYNV